MDKITSEYKIELDKCVAVKKGPDGKVGVFVGGESATLYRGQEINNIGDVIVKFEHMQQKNPHVVALHVFTSTMRGEHAKSGRPVFEHGANVWAFVEFDNAKYGNIVFNYKYSEDKDVAAKLGLGGCINSIDAGGAFYSAVLAEPTLQKQNARQREIQKLTGIDWAQLVGQIKLNGYNVTVEKQGMGR